MLLKLKIDVGRIVTPMLFHKEMSHIGIDIRPVAYPPGFVH